MTIQRSSIGAAAGARRACFVLTLLAAMPAWAAGSPAITPVPLDTPTTKAYAYPPEMRVGDFDGAVREGTAYESASFPQGRVAFWEAKAGTLKTDAYPLDEFVYVLEGELETVDRDGTRRQFGPGDTFVIPKGWAGEWRMKKDFRKLFVNF